ncbi:MAG: sulfotransferase [Myxococcota bacterium]|nr:sulfotransferase [Myxococcota bacterium]
MQRFIVGTGRCGSTLLSRMLAKSPHLLSLFEFFNGLDMSQRFAPQAIDGDTLAEFIGREQPVITAVIKRGYPVEEVTYPFADDSEAGSRPGRYRRGDALPWLLVSMLPRLADPPDLLFDELLAFARSRPPTPARDHYLALFDWLTERMDRDYWVERSGSSIDYAADLTSLYPEAHFVHLHRSGPEVALSMREHHAYRLPISLIYDAPLAKGLRVSELPPPDFESPPEPQDTVSRILEAHPPAEYFGRYWSDQITRGQPALAQLPSERLLPVTFEEMVSDPVPVLRRIARFFQLPHDSPGADWIPHAASLVQGIPRLRLPDLDDSEAADLLMACEPGSQLLDRN